MTMTYSMNAISRPEYVVKASVSSVFFCAACFFSVLRFFFAFFFTNTDTSESSNSP